MYEHLIKQRRPGTSTHWTIHPHEIFHFKRLLRSCHSSILQPNIQTSKHSHSQSQSNILISCFFSPFSSFFRILTLLSFPLSYPHPHSPLHTTNPPSAIHSHPSSPQSSPSISTPPSNLPSHNPPDHLPTYPHTTTANSPHIPSSQHSHATSQYIINLSISHIVPIYSRMTCTDFPVS